MRLAYADPPYYGCCRLYAHHHPDGRCWDDLDTHARLIDRLAEFDAWAMSLTSNSLRLILPLCPEGVRVAAWVKPFAVYKPGVNPGYCWEPVIFRSDNLGREGAKIRDFLSEPIRIGPNRKNTDGAFVPGAKSWRFSWWIFDLLGAQPTDEFHDLFVGSGAVTEAWERYRQRERIDQQDLFGGHAA